MSTLAVVGAMLAMTAPSAYAASVDQYRGSASGTGVSLTVLGSPVLGGGNSSALGRALLASILANGTATGLVGAPGSPSVAQLSAAGSVRVPATGQSCATPDLAAAGLPAPIANALQIGAACSYASAQVVSRNASGHGQSTVGNVNVSATLLAKVITDLIIPTLRNTLGTAIDPLTGPVGSALTTAKDTVCAPIQTANTVLGTVCYAALTDIIAVPVPTIDALIAAIQTAITNALRGVNLLTIGLGGSTSDVTTTAPSVGASAQGSTLTVTSPNLKFLIQVIDAAITLVLNSFIDAVATAVQNSALAKAAATLLPAGTLDQVVAAVRNQLAAPVAAAIKSLEDAALAALPFLKSDIPLITIQGVSATANATVTRATGAVSRAATAGTVVVDISPALAAFLTSTFGVNVPAHTSVAPGVDMTLFAGTPLESRVAVGATNMTSATLDGIPVLGASAEGVTLEIFRTIMGGVVFQVSGAAASAGDIPPTVPPAAGAPGLPMTSGGPISLPLPLVALLLAIASAGAGLKLRRRPRSWQAAG
ncbi:MAG: hypothetical protein ABR573_02885 [Candidatus Dormibacteria bacterium]